MKTILTLLRYRDAPIFPELDAQCGATNHRGFVFQGHHWNCVYGGYQVHFVGRLTELPAFIPADMPLIVTIIDTQPASGPSVSTYRIEQPYEEVSATSNPMGGNLISVSMGDNGTSPGYSASLLLAQANSVFERVRAIP